MCFITVAISPSPYDTAFLSDVLTTFSTYNDDGVSILSWDNQTEYFDLTRSLGNVEKKLSLTPTWDVNIIHLRQSTSGAVDEHNLHLWEHNDWYFAHNGFIPDLASKENPDSDSLQFFNILVARGLLDKTKLPHKDIGLLAQQHRLLGRFLLANKRTKRIYFFGDWLITYIDEVIYVSSTYIANLLPVESIKVMGVKLESTPARAFETKKSGKFFYDGLLGSFVDLDPSWQTRATVYPPPKTRPTLLPTSTEDILEGVVNSG